jgi:hypothetical protein
MYCCICTALRYLHAKLRFPSILFQTLVQKAHFANYLVKQWWLPLQLLQLVVACLIPLRLKMHCNCVDSEWDIQLDGQYGPKTALCKVVCQTSRITFGTFQVCCSFYNLTAVKSSLQSHGCLPSSSRKATSDYAIRKITKSFITRESIYQNK